MSRLIDNATNTPVMTRARINRIRRTTTRKADRGHQARNPTVELEPIHRQIENRPWTNHFSIKVMGLGLMSTAEILIISSPEGLQRHRPPGDRTVWIPGSTPEPPLRGGALR